MPVKPKIPIKAALPDTKVYRDSGGRVGELVGLWQVGDFIAFTSGDDLLDNGTRWIKLVLDRAVNRLFLPPKIELDYYWVEVRFATPARPEDLADWLLAAPLPSNTAPADPRTADEIEKENIALEYKQRYPTLPEPVEVYKKEGLWYYRFSSGQNILVSDFGNLTPLRQRTLSAGTSSTDLGLGFNQGETTTGNGTTTGGLTTKTWLYISGGAALLIGLLALVFTRKNNATNGSKS